MTTDQLRADTIAMIETELDTILRRHGLPVDHHHGFGIISEEVHELFQEIMRRDQNPGKIAAEAIQVAAVACKMAMLARMQAEEVQKCVWLPDIDGDAPIFSCSCGECITFADDGPKENKYKFCPFCGREIALEECEREEREEE